MTSGGARVSSGPAPDPNALNRDRDKISWIKLPRSGRPGPAPEWPLTKATAREMTLWADVWSMPQAILWERNRQFLEVAFYVRQMAEAEVIEAGSKERTLLRQQRDALLLTIPAMYSAHVLVEDDSAAPLAEVTEMPTTRTSARDRYRAPDGGA